MPMQFGPQTGDAGFARQAGDLVLQLGAVAAEFGEARHRR